MKAYKLLSRLRYLTLEAEAGQGKFTGSKEEWELVDDRDKVYKELGNFPKYETVY
jgi:chaperonin cofactor prefoldin